MMKHKYSEEKIDKKGAYFLSMYIPSDVAKKLAQLTRNPKEAILEAVRLFLILAELQQAGSKFVVRDSDGSETVFDSISTEIK